MVQIGPRSNRQLAAEPALRIQANDSIVAIDYEAPPGWSVTISRDQSSAAGRFIAVVQRKPEGKLGPVADVIRFTPIDGQGQRLPAKDLRIVGEVVQDVVVHPREIHHGRQRSGAIGDEMIRLVSLTNQPFRVTSVRSTSTDLHVSRVPATDGSWLYSLRLRFTATGDQEALTVFTIREEGAKEFEISVPVRYHGVQGPP